MRNSDKFRWWTGGMAALAGIVVLAGMVTGWADTVKLKDGSELEGKLVAETETTVSIEMQMAGGTITQTRTVNKTNVVEIIRPTPEQKSLADTRRYKLDPNNSYPKDYYDKVITNVFHKYLQEYPDSPDAAEVTEKIAAWEAERDQVASGQAKYRGEWRPGAEVAAQLEAERGNLLLKDARAFLDQGNPRTAIERLAGVVTLTHAPAQVAEAKTLLATAHQQWLNKLTEQHQDLSSRIATETQRVQQARTAFAQAEQEYQNAMGKQKGLAGPRPADQGSRGSRLPNRSGRQQRFLGPSEQPIQRMGQDAQPIINAQAKLGKARSELTGAENRLSQLRLQLATVEKSLEIVQNNSQAWDTRLAQLQALGTGTVVVASTGSEPAGEAGQTVGAASSEQQPSSTSSAATPASARSLMDWAKENVLYIAVGLIIVLGVAAKLIKT